MLRIAKYLLFTMFTFVPAFANGVNIVDAEDGVYLTLTASEVDVSVESQIAVITSTQTFFNDLDIDVEAKYAFPLLEGATAIGIRWHYDGAWHEANIVGEPADSTLPGGGGGNIDEGLKSYLGPTPLYFEFPHEIEAAEILKVELTYVELLPYEFGNVDFIYPNDYSLIQSSQLDSITLAFNMTSQRTITALQMLEGPTLYEWHNVGNEASLHGRVYSAPADFGISVQYSLDLDELGLFGFSTSLPDSQVPDEEGSGYFTFIAEPDPSNTSEIIDKVFTLIIDRSGSMGWDNKIQQARDAASFIVENLNDGDHFNIVDFSTSISTFSGEHVEFNETTRDDALDYISGLNANGSTNISGAFGVAIPQFASADENTANIIVFFTDGIPNGGIEDTDELVAYIDDLQNQDESQVMIFTFGIGEDVNEQLLAAIANNNDGLSLFLHNDELFEAITEFYLLIRNPVLLDTEIEFSPAVVSEVYPNPLPNLYIGQQMIVSGRYTSAETVTITLSGRAFGQDVSYDYALDLTDSTEPTYQFLPKIWAKQKIEYLLVQYYLLDEDSPEAEALKEEIIALSIAYGVISPFTSFSGDDPVSIDEEAVGQEHDPLSASFELLGNYPNPFNPETSIRIQVNSPYFGELKVRIYNALGQVVQILYLDVSGAGLYEVTWDGSLTNGGPASSGLYFYAIELENTVLVGRMTLVR